LCADGRIDSNSVTPNKKLTTQHEYAIVQRSFQGPCSVRVLDRSDAIERLTLPKAVNWYP
jgi:hypothetical protein